MRRHQRFAIAAFVILSIALISVTLVGVGRRSVIALSATNACKSNATGNFSDISVGLTGNGLPDPATLGAGVITLGGVNFQANVPATLLIAGYNLGLLTVGANWIRVKGWVGVSATNTSESVKVLTFTTTVSTTIGDPNGIPGTGDETATPLALDLSLADSTWTPTGGTVSFVQAPPGSLPAIAAGQVGPGAVTPVGGIFISAQVAGGLIKANFDCQVGTSSATGTTFTAGTASAFETVAVNAATTTTVAAATTVAATTTTSGATTTTSGATTTTSGATTTTSGATTTTSGATTTTSGATTTTSGATTTTSGATTTTSPSTTTTAPPGPVTGKAKYTTTCTNSVTPDKSELVFEGGGTVPAQVSANAQFKLSKQSWTVTVPASVFQTGINLGLITPGTSIKGQLDLAITGTNVSPKTQDVKKIQLTFPVTAGSDGKALPSTVAFTAPDLTWTALSGKMDFSFYGANVGVSIGLPNPVVFVCKPTAATPFVSSLAVGTASTTTTVKPAVTTTTQAGQIPVTGPGESLLVQVLASLLLLDLGYMTLSLRRAPRRR